MRKLVIGLLAVVSLAAASAITVQLWPASRSVSHEPRAASELAAGLVGADEPQEPEAPRPRRYSPSLELAVFDPDEDSALRAAVQSVDAALESVPDELADIDVESARRVLVDYVSAAINPTEPGLRAFANRHGGRFIEATWTRVSTSDDGRMQALQGASVGAAWLEPAEVLQQGPPEMAPNSLFYSNPHPSQSVIVFADGMDPEARAFEMCFPAVYQTVGGPLIACTVGVTVAEARLPTSETTWTVIRTRSYFDQSAFPHDIVPPIF